MGQLKKDISINVEDTGMVLSSLKDLNLKEISVYKESERVQDLKTVITGKDSDIALGLSACDDIEFKKLKDSKECVETENMKAALGIKVDTEANGTILFLGEDPLPDDFRYEDDQCSVVTCDVENCPASSVDGDTLEFSSGQSEDYSTLDCQTPKESIFDPFASGREELAFAPKKKMPNRARFPLCRKLNYDLFDDSFGISKGGTTCLDSVDDCLVEFISKSLLELIVTSEVKKSHDNDSVEQELDECFKTPTSLPLLTGIAETCPPAPLRPAARSKLFCKGICRKLDFGTDAV